MAQLIPRVFVASGGDSPFKEPEEYGYSEDPIAAQAMLTTYRAGMDIGDLGDAARANPVSEGVGLLMEGVVGLATVGIGAGMQIDQANKARRHEANMVKAQQELAEEEAKLAALQGDGGGNDLLPWVIGGVVVLGTVGGGFYLYTRKGTKK